MYPPVTAMTRPLNTFSGEAIFSPAGQQRDRSSPHDVAIRDGEFLNRAIGRGGIDVLPVRIGGRGTVGDLGRAGQ